MKADATLGIPPPFPFCEEWDKLPQQSTRWLTPSFPIDLAHQYPPAPHIPAAVPPVLQQPSQRFPSHDDPNTEFATTPSDGGYESSEYEYGFELTDEWAAHFARKRLERSKRHTTKAPSKRPKVKKPIPITSTETNNPLTYEVTVGQLNGKVLTLPSARVDALERRLEHTFLNDFSNPVTVCLFNA
ncbi:hypothetical protein H257_01077 [Aphanomyces astaci]|uniref:Uncharacterized protein n=1 Tax=Aphanomyces astaci TaxID=112090 RepID=W4H7J1_APHAT|nr:hypothetical protein H257_01077 [Aphanomyces astaci]ETV87536.1 hypothetical protein H257_01077 [Aphanomyces astaci]|eukprot:XP_009822399.1 hypothetical protein H257_01077 [Aphanomyces astaci]